MSKRSFKVLILLKIRAKAYFGQDEVFLEKCIDNASHIEVQIFGDQTWEYCSFI